MSSPYLDDQEIPEAPNENAQAVAPEQAANPDWVAPSGMKVKDAFLGQGAREFVSDVVPQYFSDKSTDLGASNAYQKRFGNWPDESSNDWRQFRADYIANKSK